MVSANFGHYLWPGTLEASGRPAQVQELDIMRAWEQGNAHLHELYFEAFKIEE
jgi:hypothetical protein